MNEPDPSTVAHESPTIATSESVVEPNSIVESDSIRMERQSRRIFRRRATIIGLVLLLGCFGYAWNFMFAMPGTTYQEKTAEAKSPQQSSEKTERPAEPKETSDKKIPLPKELESTVKWLSDELGERNLRKYRKLSAAADRLEADLKELGYGVSRQTFQVRGLDCHNIIAEQKGTEIDQEIVIVGAHYDSARGTPAANDNGSGVASMMALAKRFKKRKSKRTLRFVAFTNEEPPYFQTKDQMGSWVYAKKCRQADEKIIGVLSLETMGYFSDEENSQNYPAPLSAMYPSTGNFIGFVGNLGSRPLLTRVIKKFRENAKVPSEGASLPAVLQGVGWSDHWSFWQEGYQGIMITDTAPFRYPHYHKPSDTWEKIDYARLAKVVEGLVPVVEMLVDEEVK